MQTLLQFVSSNFELLNSRVPDRWAEESLFFHLTKCDKSEVFGSLRLDQKYEISKNLKIKLIKKPEFKYRKTVWKSLIFLTEWTWFTQKTVTRPAFSVLWELMGKYTASKERENLLHWQTFTYKFQQYFYR